MHTLCRYINSTNHFHCSILQSKNELKWMLHHGRLCEYPWEESYHFTYGIYAHARVEVLILKVLSSTSAPQTRFWRAVGCVIWVGCHMRAQPPKLEHSREVRMQELSTSPLQWTNTLSLAQWGQCNLRDFPILQHLSTLLPLLRLRSCFLGGGGAATKAANLALWAEFCTGR